MYFRTAGGSIVNFPVKDDSMDIAEESQLEQKNIAARNSAIRNLPIPFCTYSEERIVSEYNLSKMRCEKILLKALDNLKNYIESRVELVGLNRLRFIFENPIAIQSRISTVAAPLFNNLNVLKELEFTPTVFENLLLLIKKALMANKQLANDFYKDPLDDIVKSIFIKLLIHENIFKNFYDVKFAHSSLLKIFEKASDDLDLSFAIDKEQLEVKKSLQLLQNTKLELDEIEFDEKFTEILDKLNALCVTYTNPKQYMEIYLDIIQCENLKMEYKTFALRLQQLMYFILSYKVLDFGSISLFSKKMEGCQQVLLSPDKMMEKSSPKGILNDLLVLYGDHPKPTLGSIGALNCLLIEMMKSKDTCQLPYEFLVALETAQKANITILNNGKIPVNSLPLNFLALEAYHFMSFSPAMLELKAHDLEKYKRAERILSYITHKAIIGYSNQFHINTLSQLFENSNSYETESDEEIFLPETETVLFKKYEANINRPIQKEFSRCISLKGVRQKAEWNPPLKMNRPLKKTERVIIFRTNSGKDNIFVEPLDLSFLGNPTEQQREEVMEYLKLSAMHTASDNMSDAFLEIHMDCRKQLKKMRQWLTIAQHDQLVKAVSHFTYNCEHIIANFIFKFNKVIPS